MIVVIYLYSVQNKILLVLCYRSNQLSDCVGMHQEMQFSIRWSVPVVIHWSMNGKPSPYPDDNPRFLEVCLLWNISTSLGSGFPRLHKY